MHITDAGTLHFLLAVLQEHDELVAERLTQGLIQGLEDYFNFVGDGLAHAPRLIFEAFGALVFDFDVGEKFEFTCTDETLEAGVSDCV